jgi:hypothetical protein
MATRSELTQALELIAQRIQAGEMTGLDIETIRTVKPQCTQTQGLQDRWREADVMIKSRCCEI